MRKAILKNLIAHKLRLLLTALSITLGVAFVAGTFVLTDTMSFTFDRLFENVTRGIDLSVRAETLFGGTGSPVPEKLLDEIEAVPGVQAAEGTVGGYAQLVDKEGEAISTGGAPTLGVSWAEESQLGPLSIRRGRAPVAAGEVAIDAATARDHHLDVGDTITILFQGPPGRFEIVGIAGFGAADNLAGASLAAFETTTAQRVLGFRNGFSSIEIVSENEVPTNVLESRIRSALPDGYEVVRGRDLAEESAREVKEGLAVFQRVILVFGGIALFVGAFIILNTFSITVAQRLRETALLRTLGATGGQVTRSVLAEALVVGLLASVVGLGLGYLGAIGLQALLGAFGIDVPSAGTRLELRTAVVALTSGLVVTLLAAFLPALRAGRVPPLAALRDAEPTSQGPSRRRAVVGVLMVACGTALLASGLAMTGSSALPFVGLGCATALIGLAVLAPFLSGPLARAVGAPLARVRGFTGRLARDNAVRNPARTAATAAALMIGLALVTFAAVAAASLKATTAAVVDDTIRADFTLTSSQFIPFSHAVARRLESRAEVGIATPVRYAFFRRSGQPKGLSALDPAVAAHVLDIDLIEGTLDDLDGGVMIREDVARSDDLDVGDTLAAGFEKTGKQKLEIAGIYEDNLLLGDYMISLDTYDQHYVEKLDGIVYVTTAPGVSPGRARAAMEEEVEGFPNVELRNQVEIKDAYAEQVDRLLAVVYALLGLAVLIALLGIVNTLALSVLERTRELGLLRAIGLTRRQVRSAVRWEAILIAVIGAVLGIIAGLGFAAAIMTSLEDITRVAFPVAQLGSFVLLAAGAGVLAAIPATRRAARVDILRAVTVE